MQVHYGSKQTGKTDSHEQEFSRQTLSQEQKSRQLCNQLALVSHLLFISFDCGHEQLRTDHMYTCQNVTVIC